MGYTMKRGNSAVPFKTLGSSPAKQNDLTKETDNTRDNSEQVEKKSNASFKGNIMTNTETGDTYNLKTGETIKNRQSKETPRKEKEPTTPADYKESPAKKIDPTLANKTSKESDAPKQKGKFHTYETKQYDKEGNERTGDNKEAEEFTHKSQFDESGREFSTTEPGGVADTVYWNKPKK